AWRRARHVLGRLSTGRQPRGIALHRGRPDRRARARAHLLEKSRKVSSALSTHFQASPTSIQSVPAPVHSHRSTLMARFANILGTVGNTPVVKITRLAPPDVNLYVKIEAFNPLGSVKDRLALGIIEEAARTGELK